MGDIELSIIIPMYRAEKYIGKCLRSITRQKLRNVEIVCVDDGSDDSTCEVVERAQVNNPEIKLIRIQLTNASHARNVGIDNAHGKYLMFVDADDYIVGNIKRAIRFCKTNNVDILVYGGTTTEPFNTGNWIRLALAPHNRSFSKFEPNILYENGAIPFTWNKLFKRELFDNAEIRFDEEVTVGEDNLFQYTVFPKAKSIHFKNYKIYCYRVNQEGSLTALDNKNLTQKTKEHLLLVTKIGKVWEKYGFKDDDTFAKHYCTSMLGFMYENITSLPIGEDKREISAKLIEQMDSWNANNYVTGNYNVMLNIFRYIANGNEKRALELVNEICKKPKISAFEQIMIVIRRAKDIGLRSCTEYYIQKYVLGRGY